MDNLIFTIADSKVKLLLIQRGRDPYRGYWALPGGFVEEFEALEVASRRELHEETNLASDIPLVQIGAFGDPGRDPRHHTVCYYNIINAFLLYTPPLIQITVGFMGFVPNPQCGIRAGGMKIVDNLISSPI